MDDGLIFGADPRTCTSVVEELSKQFDIKTLSGSNFLVMEIKKLENGYYISQPQYITELLTKHKLMSSNAMSTQLADTKILYNHVNSPKCRHVIGGALYCGVNTRPDILFPTILLSRFNEDPRHVHWVAAQRILKYLKGTKNKGLFCSFNQKQTTVDAYCDALKQNT